MLGIHIQTWGRFLQTKPEARGVSLLQRAHPLRHHHQKTETKLELEIVFSKKRGVSQHTCETGCQPLPVEKTAQDSKYTQNFTEYSNFNLKLSQSRLSSLYTDVFCVRITSLS